MKKIKFKNIYKCPNCLRIFSGYINRCPICKKKVTKLEEEDNTLINIVKRQK